MVPKMRFSNVWPALYLLSFQNPSTLYKSCNVWPYLGGNSCSQCMWHIMSQFKSLNFLRIFRVKICTAALPDVCPGLCSAPQSALMGSALRTAHPATSLAPSAGTEPSLPQTAERSAFSLGTPFWRYKAFFYTAADGKPLWFGSGNKEQR